MKTEVRLINKKYLYVRSYKIFTLKELKESGDDGFDFNIVSFYPEDDIIRSSSLSFVVSKFFVCDCKETSMQIGDFFMEIKGNMIKITHEYITKMKRGFYTKGLSFRDTETRKLFEGGDEEDEDFKISIFVDIKPQYFRDDNIVISLPEEYRKELENGIEGVDEDEEF